MGQEVREAKGVRFESDFQETDGRQLYRFRLANNTNVI